MTMRYQELKVRENREQRPQESQQGVTLLLAILVLSAITALSFSLAAIVFSEIRASGDLQRTEPALYATQGVIEQSIFKVQREVPDAQMCFDSTDANKLVPPGSATQTACQNNTPIKSNIAQIQITGVASSDVSESPLQDAVTTAYNTTSNTKNVYVIYDAENPNNPQNGYTKIRVENRSNIGLRYTFCRVNDISDPNGPTDCTPPSWTNCNIAPPAVSGSSWLVYDGVINALGFAEHILNKTYIYRMYVYQQCNQTAPAFVDVYSYGPVTPDCGLGDDCPKGLPLKGKKQVDVTAANAGLTRRYRVLVPLAR